MMEEKCLFNLIQHNSLRPTHQDTIKGENSKLTLRHRLAAAIGNFLEHYDNALFGFLTPFIAPLFFKESNPITALILTYGILPLGFFTRPLGSICFGWIGDNIGRKQALFFSLFGMAMVTVSIGALPDYEQIGPFAPLFLAAARMLQSFFAAGESVGGAIFVLEHTSKKNRSFVSSLYDASSIGGILIASFAVTGFGILGIVESNWRLLFLGGGITAVIGIFLRWFASDGTEFIDSRKIQNGAANVFDIIKLYWKPLLAIIMVSGFTYTTYSLAFNLMNGFIPLVTSLTKTDVIAINTLLLVIDMVLLPFFGFLTKCYGKERVMLAAAFTAGISGIPLFCFLKGATVGVVIFIRTMIIIPGVAFAAPYHAWTLERVAPQHRYLVLSLGYAIGSQLIGAPTSAVSLWLYQMLGWTFAPGLYLLAAAFGAGLVVYSCKKENVS